MGVNIIIQSRDYFTQFTNGNDYTLNTSERTNFLNGNVMNKVQFNSVIDVDWNSKASETNEFEWLRSGTTITTTRLSGSFIADGFAIGDTLDAFFSSSGPFAGVITSITDTVMVQTNATLASFLVGLFGPSVTSGTSQSLSFYGTTPLSGLLFKFGLIENNESDNYISKLTNTEQEYSVDLGSPQSTTFVTGDSLGLNQAWKSGDFECKYVSNPSTYVQRFEVKHEFIINPYYEDGGIDNILDVQPPDLYDGADCLKYICQYEFRNFVSNPNTAKTQIDNFQLGSTGWFNENYNGLPNNYSITSVDYEDDATALPADGLLVGGTTLVTVVVASSLSSFLAAQPVVVHHSWLAPLDQYEYQTDDLPTTWLFESLRNEISAVANSDTLITDLAIVLDSAAQITVTFKTTFTSPQQALLSADEYFVLGIEVGNGVVAPASVDRVNLLISGQYDLSPDVPDLMDVTRLELVDHPNVVGAGFTDIKTWVEDGFTVDFDFELDLNLSAVIESLSVKIAAYNSSTEEYFELQSVPLDLSGQVLVPNGAFTEQRIEINTVRGFNLPIVDEKNLLFLTTGTLAGGVLPYNGQVGIKINWQDWLALPDADSVFYDAAKENNGLNNNASNYSLVNGYAIRIFIVGDVNNGTGSTEYIFSTVDCDVRNYDLPADWTGTIQTLNSAATDLNGTILTNQDTTFKVTWEQLSGAVTDITDFYAIHRIEEIESPTKKNIEEFSSILTVPVVQSKLKPLSGETRTKISLVSGKVVTECLVDYTNLNPTKTYKISARLGSLTNSAGTIDGAKLLEDGDFKLLEDGDFKLLE